MNGYGYVKVAKICKNCLGQFFPTADENLCFSCNKHGYTLPTTKAEEIEKLLTLTAGISRSDAQQQTICTICKKTLTPFRNPQSLKEYQISGMCQKCQDSIFGSD